MLQNKTPLPALSVQLMPSRLPSNSERLPLRLQVHGSSVLIKGCKAGTLKPNRYSSRIASIARFNFSLYFTS